MLKISTHIYNEIKDSNINIKKIELEERKIIINSIKEKYIDIDKKGEWLWEKFIHHESLYDNMG